MATRLIANYEPQAAEDPLIGRIETDRQGRAVLHLDGKQPRAYRNPNAALAAVREDYGWPQAYLQ